MKITEIKFKCDKCGKEKIYKNIDIVEKSYNQYVIDIFDQDEENFESHCKCEYEDLEESEDKS